MGLAHATGSTTFPFSVPFNYLLWCHLGGILSFCHVMTYMYGNSLLKKGYVVLAVSSALTFISSTSSCLIVPV